MIKLQKILCRQINRFGPMSIADYMTQCLLHPDYGYYTQKNPIGANSDFITSPEISQMFGELIGLNLAQTWLDQGSPSPFCLTELGPGQGSLMQDILRVTKSIPGFHAAMKINLVEVSPTLKKRQKQALAQYSITWIDSIADLPTLPLFLIANEFFDCLPIRQFLKGKNDWQEQMIGVTDTQLCFVLGTKKPNEIFQEYAHLPQGSIVEASPSTLALSTAIALHIASFGGAAIIIDYGDWGSNSDTFQSVKDHKKCSPLTYPGQSDLTAHVDFKAISTALSPIAKISSMVTQGILLERLGITTRAQQLAQNMSKDTLKNHIAAHRRLTHPDEMGALFKMIAIVANGQKLPTGFED